MNNLKNDISDGEIDLKKYFLILWAYKMLIICSVILSVIFGGFYILSQDTKFTSTAIFKMDTDTSMDLKSSGEFRALTSIAGISSSSLTNEALRMDKVTGRIFIEKLNKKIDFINDPYFNVYNPVIIDPVWKAIIKRSIGWKKNTPADLNEAMWQGIVNEYLKNISIEETKSGSIKIRVTHTNSNRASIIANAIMVEILDDQKEQKNEAQDVQLNYLSKTLADALYDLEVAQSNLKAFTLENSVMPLESFAAGSLALEELRDQYDRTSILHNAITELDKILMKENISQEDYYLLRKNFPIVDQLEFRRILGQSEVVSSWSWPDRVSVSAVNDTLIERKLILKSKIDISQKIAESSGRAVEAFGKLEREATIAEATYTVLIEQVKAQSMIAGFRPDNSEVYEFASPSSAPSEPKRIILMIISSLLGLLIGCVVSIILSKRKNVYYSKGELISDVQPLFSASSSSLNIFKNRKLVEISRVLKKQSKLLLRDLTVEINKNDSKFVVFTSSNTKVKSGTVARALAIYNNSKNLKIAIIDFSNKNKEKLEVEEKNIIESFIYIEKENNVSILVPRNDINGIEFITNRNFIKELQSLNVSFDLVFICGDNEDALTLLRAMEKQDVFHISMVRTKHTKLPVLSQMTSILSIQGLLYD